MKKNLTQILIIVNLLLLTNFNLKANGPFTCEVYAYLFQGNDVYSVDLASGQTILEASNIVNGTINATAYNPKDEYIWGSVSNPDKAIARVSNDYTVETFVIDGLTSSNSYIGDINEDGIYYLKPGGVTTYMIDVDPASPNYLSLLGTFNLSENHTIADWAFNPVDGYLYTIAKGSNFVIKIDPSTGIVQILGVASIIPETNYVFGACYFDVDGNLYASANSTGTIYKINETHKITSEDNLYSSVFAFGPASSSNDGARCPTAPVPQEICDNGIDDDGDGLVDCDDAACLNTSGCPEYSPSGGEEGGLESNNRLSEKIAQRKFQNQRSNKKLSGPSPERRIKRTDSYGILDVGNKDLETLSSFFPINVIENTETYISTPTDLIDLTNANAVYATDIYKADRRTATILGLHTQGSVYEHTKYICDRLLGAEILNIAPIHFNEKEFINTIFKNPDGSIVFATSISLRMNGADFADIQSHWSLDRYPGGENFYSFQIWSNSIDDLIVLAESLLNIMEDNLEINSYNCSGAPSTYVKKGKYENGKLRLEIQNNSYKTSWQLEGGIVKSETSEEEDFTTEFTLNPRANNIIEIETGTIFNAGLRLSKTEGGGLPDDIFFSDGPWGINYDEQTEVVTWEVSSSAIHPIDEALHIERNVMLEAETTSEVFIYRAFNAHFAPVDMTEFNNVKFNASGDGRLEIRIMKKGIETWEEQFYTSLILDENQQSYSFHVDQFTSTQNAITCNFEDIYTISFKLVPLQSQSVSLSLEDLAFSKREDVVSPDEFNELLVYPNPILESSNLSFHAEEAGQAILSIYQNDGKLVRRDQINVNRGLNNSNFEKGILNPGAYTIKLRFANGSIKFGKIIVL